MNYLIRAPTAIELDALRERVVKCFEGAATVTGCKVNIEVGILVKELRNDFSLGVRI